MTSRRRFRGGAIVAIAILSASAQARAAGADELAIVVPPAPPEGFDRNRLMQRIQVYVGSLATVVDADGAADGGAGAGSGQPPRFVVSLHWPERAMTPLEVSVADASRTPAQTYAIQVQSAQSWDELERLVALKLLSVLRVATAPPPAPAAPAEPAEPAAPAPQSVDDGAVALRPRPLVELGGGVATSNGFDAPRLAGALRLAWVSDRWAFGVATTLTFRHWENGAAAADADVLETTWAASLRHDVWRPTSSRWLAQIGGELGLFAARVAGERPGQERTAYALSPLASALVLGGYRLAADGSALILAGPAVDLLWTRSEITAAAAPLYDSGHIRLRGELKLVLAL